MTALQVQEFEKIQDPNVRQRLDVDGPEIKDYLNGKMEYILNHRAVQHPLLNLLSQKTHLLKNKKRNSTWKLGITLKTNLSILRVWQ
ncbi:hypothetical protein FJR38_08410 [Anabaena sp. UHCC 0253]|uniref:hypothetical protein n=1 Tax=Anabaena sp. UHCC 0253 TaxID=2590019 RepID=UPI001444FA1E|nr:hypothetical protein [Anabaena sp. UHCC 0253]MTJ52678.1 hypothetical protein [Anabaena sp. UHCC 0253]